MIKVCSSHNRSTFTYFFSLLAGLPEQQQRLCWMINNIVLSPSSSLSPALILSLRTLILSLARLKMFSTFVYIPTLLLSVNYVLNEEGGVNQQILDQALSDADILHEYMQRINLIGWTSRNQFEEWWMQILQVWVCSCLLLLLI